MDQVNATRAFSLVELLVVLAIISIVAVLALPALSSSMTSTRLTNAGQMISDTIGLARQEAVAKDRNVQVRFYNLTSGTWPGWRAFQVFRVEQGGSGATLVPVTKLHTLPDGIVISATLSPLLTADPAVTGTASLPSYGNATYAGFYFLASGEVESALNPQNNYLTLQSATASGSPPTNYSTLQINTVTGRVSTFRP